MDASLFLRLAEVAGPPLSGFEQRLHGQLQLILWMYGGVFLIGLCLLIGFTLRIQEKPLSWDAPLRKLGDRPWSWRDAAWIMFPLILIQAVAVSVLLRIGMDGEEPGTELVVLVAQSLLFHWVGLALVLGMMIRRKFSWYDSFGFEAHGLLRHIAWGALILVGVMPLILGYNMVSQIVMEWMGINPDVQDVTRIMSESKTLGSKIYLAVLALMIAPVVEELLFRGVLLPALSKLAGVKPAIVFVSLLFAAVHGHLPSFVPLFMLSIAFCLAYIYRGSLVTSIVMHSCFNALTIAVILQM